MSASPRSRREYVADTFTRYYRDGDPDDIMPEILAARCLGLTYGDPGPPNEQACKPCWGERKIWLGNAWGNIHAGGTIYGCVCSCHRDEVWLA